VALLRSVSVNLAELSPSPRLRRTRRRVQGIKGLRPYSAPNPLCGGASKGFRELPTDGGEEGVDVDAGQQDGGK
jgi:hypothetical protein